MAKPIRNRAGDAAVRAKIQTSQLINRLQGDALGKLDLTDGQRASINILLRKSLPDLSAVELTGGEGGPLKMVCTWQMAE